MGIIREFVDIWKNCNKNVRWFMLCIFINGVSMSLLSVMLGIYYKNIGLSEAVIGNLISLRTLGSSVGAVFALTIVHTMGMKRGLFLSSIIMILSGFAFVNIINVPVMQAANFIFGMAQIVLTVVQAPFLKKNSDDSSVVGIFSAAFAIMNMAMFVGSFAFGALSDFFATRGGVVFGSKMSLNLGFVISIVILYSIIKIDFGTSEEKRSGKGGLKEYFKILDKTGWIYMLRSVFTGIGAGAVIPFFSVYIKFTLNASDSVVGAIMSFSQFGTVIGGMCVPWLARKFGQLNTVIWCQLLSIPFLLSISMPQGAIMMAMSFFFRSTLMNMASPIISGMAMDLVEEKNRTVMSSLFTLADNLFRAAGTSMGGWLMLNVSYNVPYYVTIVTYILGTIVIYAVFSKDKRYKKV